MIRIAICDDEVQQIERIQDLLNEYIQENPIYEITVHSFTAPFELVSYVAEQGSFDILLLDIYMAGMLGTEAARELRMLGDQGEIIFLTSSRDHAIEAFEVEAAQYIIKPYSKEAIFSALQRVMKRIQIDKRVTIPLKTTEGMIRLAIRDVVFTETGKNNYQKIHTIQGKKIEVRMTATELYDLFSGNKFIIRCGASINVNLKYIRQISKEFIIFDTGAQLSYPYRAYPKLKEVFLRFQMFPEE